MKTPLLIRPLMVATYADVGFKGATLKSVFENKIPIPKSYFVSSNQLNKILSKKSADWNIRSFMRMDKYDARIASEILKYISNLEIAFDIDGLFLNCSKIIVRSSEVISEKYATTVSGAFDSCSTGMNKLQITEAIKTVWRSAFSRKAFNQNSFINKRFRTAGIGILIQPFHNAVYSGLLQSFTDYLGYKLCYKLTCIEGHLSSIVAGEKTGNEIFIAPKVKKVGNIIIGQEDVIKRIISKGYGDVLNKLVLNVNRITQFYYDKIEVEWLFDGNSILILQCQMINELNYEK